MRTFFAMFLFFVETYTPTEQEGFDWIIFACFLISNIIANPFWNVLPRKKLDPLEAYVPAVILTQLQMEDLGNNYSFASPFSCSIKFLTYKLLLGIDMFSSFHSHHFVSSV